MCVPCRQLGRSITKLLRTGGFTKEKVMEKKYKRFLLCFLAGLLRDTLYCSSTVIWSAEVPCGTEKICPDEMPISEIDLQLRIIEP